MNDKKMHKYTKNFDQKIDTSTIIQKVVIITYQFLFTECNCNLQGSKNNKCRPDSGKCECKDGYSGIRCDVDFPIREILFSFWS